MGFILDKASCESVTIGNMQSSKFASTDNSHKVAMFLKLQFLESKARREFFEQCPSKVVYVSSGRLACAKNGDFNQYAGKAMSFAWFIWKKGYKGDTILKWFN